MKSAFILPAVALGTLLAALASGCASVDDPQAPANDASRSQRGETITGSHIPNKFAMPAQSDAERQKTVERMKELQQTSPPVQTKP